MITIIRGAYILLLSYNPCDVFTYYNVDEMHGLSLVECNAYHNTPDSAYIAGWCNYAPQEDGIYEKGDPKFVYINLTRCTTDIETFGLIMHELMHQSFDMHDDEEDIITWAEEESYKVFEIVKHELKRKRGKNYHI
jgi:hypothetical protein